MKIGYFLLLFLYSINALKFPKHIIRLPPLKTFEMLDNYPSYEKIKMNNTKYKKLSVHLNKLDKIVEEDDECDHCDKNIKNIKNTYNTFVEKKIIIKVNKTEKNKKKNNEKITIFKVISTTFITLSLTYIIWFII